jgi:hypothetical protein
VAFLLAEDAVARMRFDDFFNDWNNSDLKRWLNEDFYNGAFSEKERDAIVNCTYSYGGKYEGSDKTAASKVFLLSADDAENGKFFVNNDDRSTEDTWWLRSPGNIDGDAAYVHNVGEVYGGGDYVRSWRAVRPALKINLESAIFTSSSSKYEILYGVTVKVRGAAEDANFFSICWNWAAAEIEATIRARTGVKAKYFLVDMWRNYGLPFTFICMFSAAYAVYCDLRKQKLRKAFKEDMTALLKCLWECDCSPVFAVICVLSATYIEVLIRYPAMYLYYFDRLWYMSSPLALASFIFWTHSLVACVYYACAYNFKRAFSRRSAVNILINLSAFLLLTFMFQEIAKNARDILRFFGVLSEWEAIPYTLVWSSVLDSIIGPLERYNDLKLYSPIFALAFIFIKVWKRGFYKRTSAE